MITLLALCWGANQIKIMIFWTTIFFSAKTLQHIVNNLLFINHRLTNCNVFKNYGE